MAMASATIEPPHEITCNAPTLPLAVPPELHPKHPKWLYGIDRDPKAVMQTSPPPKSKSNSRARSSKQMASAPLSVEADVPTQPGEGKPRRHPFVRNGDFVSTFKAGVDTLYDAFVNACTQYAPMNFLGWRAKTAEGTVGPYQFMTYGEVYARVQNIAAGLASLNLPGKSNIGLYSINRSEWFLSEYACYFNNFVTVPLYDTLGDEAIEHICNQTEMAVMIAANVKALNVLRLKGKIPSLKTIVCMDDDISDELAMKAAKTGVELVKLSNVERRGADNPRDPVPPQAEDLCTICYTSGTTGTPKGVMLQHKALLADASSVLTLAGEGDRADREGSKFLFRLGPDLVHISYLPLAHVYERVVMTTLAAVGATIGFYQGDVLKLMDDIAELRPTLFITVPRLLNRIYDKIMANINNQGALTKFLFNMAYKNKAYNLEKNKSYQHWLWDRLVFNKVRNRLGGRVEAILTGSAPVAPQVMDFLRICFACEVYEGYGQTETSAGSTLTSRGDWTTGQIGVPIPSNEIKLVDIPEMGYTSQDQPHPRGEICIRGPNCFIGYYKSPELTKEALDDEGWVHTGDVGEWDEMGRLRIIDRKKNIFKLAQGEYISPEKVENTICRNKYIAQAFVEGNSLKASLVAIIVPDFEVLEPWARENSLTFSDHADLAKQPEVRELILGELKGLGSKGTGELKGFEVPREVYIETTHFSIENELLTSTMKLKRHEAKKHYSKQIEEMYANIKD